MRSALFGAWTPHPRITVVPWMTTWMTTGGQHALINGLGDMELSGRVLVARDKTFGDDAGFPYADDDQPGSGSWDPFFGVTYAWYSGGLWSAYGSGSYRYTTEGWHGYRRGMQAGWNAAVQAQPWSWGGFQPQQPRQRLPRVQHGLLADAAPAADLRRRLRSAVRRRRQGGVARDHDDPGVGRAGRDAGRLEGQDLSPRMWRMSVLRNDVKQGPFVASAPFTFTVGP